MLAFSNSFVLNVSFLCGVEISEKKIRFIVEHYREKISRTMFYLSLFQMCSFLYQCFSIL